MLTFGKQRGKRTRISRMAVESHWNDFTRRLEETVVKTKLAIRMTPSGKRINYSFQ